ncbi:hypothetical protein PQX77_006727 [Marasmius sp. AFHP31]|nr:hypothetical protein PQX77_006727 [Marasmius sp. AFHP31]
MSSQKALYLEKKNGAFVLRDRDIPALTASKPGSPVELLVKVHAAAANPIDWKMQKFGLLLKDDQYPLIIGFDVAGEVMAIGEGGDNSAGIVVGDRILFQGTFGPRDDYAGYQQYAKATADVVSRIPKSVTYTQAASIPVGLSAAANGLFAEFPKGAGLNPTLDESVKYLDRPFLVVGGSTSVGQYIIQLLRWSGFSPIITYASAKHASHLKSLGATHVIDRTTVELKDLPTEVKKITQTPLKIVFDSVSAPETQAAGYACVADEGTLVVITPPSVQQQTPGKKVLFADGTVALNLAFGRNLFGKVERWLEYGTIVPNRVEELANGLEGLQEAIGRLGEGRVSGVKLVALPQETSSK